MPSLRSSLSLTVLFTLAACGDGSSEPADTTGLETSEATGAESTAGDADAETSGDTSDDGADGETTGNPTDDTGDSSDAGDTGETGTGGGEPFTPDVRNYVFGHSLLLHTQEANVPMWLNAFADAAGHTYALSGQYGFADTHAAELPPDPAWGVQGVPSAWDDDSGVPFEDVDFTTILLTEANFRQYYPPTEPDPDGFLPESTVDSTTAVFDWVAAAEPTGVRYIIYENWPDMAGYTSADFQSQFPTPAELADYHAYTTGVFHQWWLDYHDAMMAARPDLEVRMVPVGPVLAGLLQGPLSDLPVEEYYEDDAPHGRPNLYFLASVVTYMAVYGVAPPADYVVPDSIHPFIRDRYAEIVTFAWDELQNFVDDEGISRVF